MASESSSVTRYRWWRDPRWLITILATVAIGSFVWGLFGPEPRLIVARETTFITEPLRPDGTPDYAKHVLDLLGRGTPPDDNAAVALLQATWPMDLDADDLVLICKALGIPDTPPDVPSLAKSDHDKDLRKALRRFLGLGIPDDGIPMHSNDEAASRVFDLIDAARTYPWAAADCPPLAAWVERQSPALDLIAAGANRPKYELPLPDLLRGDADTMLVGVVMLDLTHLRDLGRELTMRAMLRLGEGKVSEAWRDIHAVHRFARLIAPAGRPSFLVRHLLSRALQSTANAATVTLLDSPDLSEAMVTSIRRDLGALPPLADIGSSRMMERLGVVDIVVAIARMPRSERAQFYSLGVMDEPGLALRTSLDMNVVLRAVNDHVDQIDAALALPSHAERSRALLRINADIAAPPYGPGGFRKAMWLAQLAMNRGARSFAFARNLMGLLTSASGGILDAYERAGADSAVLRLAAALAEYRVRGLGGEGKPYPETLADLVPEVLDAVPDDPCSGTPLHYERRGEGHLLYSVGPDGTDDGGTNEELAKGEWRAADDFPDSLKSRDMAIRVPRPKRSLAPTPATEGE
jgi:hypothetical protein